MKRINIYMVTLLLLVAALAKAQTVFTLQRAIDTAMRNNTEMQEKRMDVEALKELKKQLYKKYFPSVSATATAFMRNRGVGEGSELLDFLFTAMSDKDDFVAEDVQILKYGAFGGLRVVQPIYAGGRITSSNKLSEIGIEATSELAAIKEDELKLEVEKYFWQLVQLYEMDKSLATMDSLADCAKHDAALALKAGLVTPNDKMQVDIKVSQLESAHLQVDNGKKLCKEYMAYLLGVEKMDSVVWDDIYATKEPAHYLTNPETALLDRHETRLLQLKIDAARQQKKYVKGTLMPTVGAMFALSYHHMFSKRDGGLYKQYFDPHSTGWAALANVSVPISAWWGGKHALKRADISISKAEADYDDKSRKMKVQISMKWNTLNEKYKQVEIAARQLKQTMQNQRQQAIAYRSGTTTMTDRLQADALYEKSRTSYIDACVKYKIAITEYMNATGR